ncbi:major facilitator superfamily domain-containing protein 6-like [Oratosquilla oratoria]|uniref:major facilitator superfamily domain-containing protein 6-like n=1 Tax=Oratosquilla oratoria TaxID=337810 RepID=UPI003F7691DF
MVKLEKLLRRGSRGTSKNGYAPPKDQKEVEDDFQENKSCWETLKKEFRIDRKLLPIKVIIFMFTGGVAAYLPFLTLHMQSLGITVEEIAIIYAVLPVSSLLGPPIAGLLADRFGRYSLVLMVNMVLTAIFHTMLLYVPPMPTVPSGTLGFQCHPEGYSLAWKDGAGCLVPNNVTTLLRLERCLFACDGVPPLNETSLCLHSDEDTLCIQINVTEGVELNATFWSEPETGDLARVQPLFNKTHFDDLTCPSVPDEQSRNGTLCTLQCDVVGGLECEPTEETPPGGFVLNTFWTYFALRLVGTLFLSSSFTMMDALTLAMLKKHGGAFGKQRVMTMLGLGVIPLIAGIVIDRWSVYVGKTDYMPAFYIGDAFLLLGMAMLFKIQLSVDLPSDNLIKDLKKIVTRIEIDVFLVMVLILGSNWGFIESYLFVFLKELNAPNYMLGLTLTVGCLVGIPMLYWSDAIVERWGRHNIFLISFFTYSIRMFGYSFITDPWLCFPFEMLEVFTYQIMWVAAATYCPILAPRGLMATMTGLAGAVHYSVGRGVGAFMGGYLISELGTPGAFRVFGVIAVVGGILYFFAHIFILKKRVAQRERELEEEKKQSQKESICENPNTLGGDGNEIDVMAVEVMHQFQRRRSSCADVAM